MTLETLAPRLHAALERPMPEAVRVAARSALLHAAVTARTATQYGVPRILRTLAERQAGKRVAPIAGCTERTDVYHSALINGAAAGDASFGALMALMDAGGLDGGRVLTAYALGFEVRLRLTELVAPHGVDGGWDVEAVCGVIGAAVTAGLLLALDAEGLAHAIGIAVSETLGHRREIGTATGALHHGKAASNGAIAALFARRGFTGSRSLDAYAGFFTVFPPRADADPAGLVESLGARWELETVGPAASDNPPDAGLAEAIRRLDGEPSAGSFSAAVTAHVATGNGAHVA